MIRDLLTLLAYEVKRHSKYAELVADISRLSEQAIKTAEVPPWVRQALLLLKAKTHESAQAASVADWAIDDTIPDPIGLTRRWQGTDQFVRVGKTELLMKPGQLIWLDRDGLWIDTIHTRHIDPKLHSLTVPHARMTRTEYYALLRETANRAKPVQSGSAAPFLIYRPG